MKKLSGMNKLKFNEKDKLHFVWFTILICCYTYCYQKSKATDSYNETSQAATSNCNLEIVKSLIKDMAPNLSGTALHCAARKGSDYQKIIRFLIKEEKVNIKVLDRNTFKRIALHHAAGEGHLEGIKFLLKKGANPNIRDIDGKNPRDVAVLRSQHNEDKPYREIIKLLAKAEDTFQVNK